MEDLRFAVVGAGFWAGYQTAAWREIRGATCVAICDHDRAKAERLASARGIPAVYTDVAEMFAHESIDFLDIVTDVASHVPLVRLAASHGESVICQKPMAATLPECEQLVAECQAAGVTFLVHENWRWQAPLRRVKELLDAGEIGTPFRARIDMISGFNVFQNQPQLRSDERFIISDLGCHLFDLARGLFGEVAAVYCRTQRIHVDIRGEDVATVVLSMRGGATVTVNMAYAETPLERECFPETMLLIEGDRGSIEVSPGCRVRVTTRAGTQLTRVTPPKYAWVDPDYAVVQSSIVACLTDLLRALRTGHVAETDARDNLRTMRVVFAAYDSAATGQARFVDRDSSTAIQA